MARTPEEEAEFQQLQAEFGQAAPMQPAPSPAPAPQPQGQPQFAQGDIRDNEVTAGLYNFAASVPFAEKAAAGVQALPALFNDKNVSDVYNEKRDEQKNINEIYDRDRNTAANVGYIGGSVANPANWTLGKFGLLANSGLQAGSDTDFSKEGAGGQFAKQTAQNLALGKLLQKGTGMVTGSKTKQKAGDLIAKNIPQAEVDASVKAAGDLADYGVEKAPAVFGGGKKTKQLLGVAAKDENVAEAASSAVNKVSDVLGKTNGKSDLGSLGKNVSNLYDQDANTQIAKAGFNRFLQGGSPAAGYVQEAITKFPGLVKQYGYNSGAILQKAQELARTKSIGEGDIIADEISQLSGGLFNKANKGYSLLQTARDSAKPLYKAAATAEKKDLNSQINNKSTNYAAQIAAVPFKLARKTLGAVGLNEDKSVQNLISKPSGKVRKQLVKLLAEMPAEEYSKVASMGSKNKKEALVRALLNNPQASKLEQQIAIAGTRKKEND